jgi:hypothetical protein
MSHFKHMLFINIGHLVKAAKGICINSKCHIYLAFIQAFADLWVIGFAPSPTPTEDQKQLLNKKLIRTTVFFHTLCYFSLLSIPAIFPFANFLNA